MLLRNCECDWFCRIGTAEELEQELHNSLAKLFAPADENTPNTPAGDEAENEEKVTMWARVGMTLRVTPEESEKIRAGDCTCLRKALANSAEVDGETYFPGEANGLEGSLDFYL